MRLEQLEDRNLLVIVVNTQIDEGDGSITDGDISLRDAIDRAPIGETFNFAPSLNGGTIALTSALLQIQFGKSSIIDATMLRLGITVNASGTDPTPTQNDGMGTSVFSITPNTANTTIILAGLTITGGDSRGAGGGILYSPGFGGVNGSFTIRDRRGRRLDVRAVRPGPRRGELEDALLRSFTLTHPRSSPVATPASVECIVQ
jgi:hypothetical protein